MGYARQIVPRVTIQRYNRHIDQLNSQSMRQFYHQKNLTKVFMSLVSLK